jgi:hypothetical protein
MGVFADDIFGVRRIDVLRHLGAGKPFSANEILMKL